MSNTSRKKIVEGEVDLTKWASKKARDLTAIGMEEGGGLLKAIEEVSRCSTGERIAIMDALDVELEEDKRKLDDIQRRMDNLQRNIRGVQGGDE